METDSSQMFSADDDAGNNNRNQECKQFVKLMVYDVCIQLMYFVFSSH